MKTLRKTTQFLVLSVLAGSLALTGCNFANKGNKATDATSNEPLMTEDALKPEIQKLLYEFPTPFEATLMLQKANAGFIFDMTNPVANVGKYISEKSKALNLGVYSCDVCYAAAYNRADELNELLKCTGKLADELGLSGLYSEDLLNQIKANANNKDSLVSIITNLFSQTNSLLSKSNRDKVTLLAVTGGFVETLYLATSLNMLAKDNQQIATIIFDQKDNLDKLLTIYKDFSSDEDMKAMADQVGKLKAVFTDYGLEANKVIAFDKAGQIRDLTEGIRNGLIQ